MNNESEIFLLFSLSGFLRFLPSFLICLILSYLILSSFPPFVLVFYSFATCCIFILAHSKHFLFFLPSSYTLFLSFSSLPCLHRLAGCYAGPVARGRSPGVDVIPGSFGCRVYRHETAVLRTYGLHALCIRSACT